MINNNIIVSEQEEIMNIDNKNIIVSASAGSGKTTVMIRKILKYILNGNCHIDELLVLTYTKSAASEMKKKLIDKIKDNLESNPSLIEELENVQFADICTFDSFCQKIVKKYFYILDIDPSFIILEGGDKIYAQSKALKETLKELKKINPNTYELLLNYFSPNRDEEKIKEIILQIYSYTTSLLNINDFKEKTLKLYNNNEKIAEKFLNSYYFSIFKQIRSNLEGYLNTSKNLEIISYVEYINNLLSICNKFLCENTFSHKIDLLNDIDYKILRKNKLDGIELNLSIANEKAKLKNNIDKIKENFVSEETINKSYQECNSLIYSIFETFDIFVNKYNNIKKSLNSFDFDDIERLTIKLLENEVSQNEIKNTYKYIFVDEFQDANSVQEKIIKLLQNNNLFFVGDTKQSIYAFRQSDPDIFLNIENEFLHDKNSEAKTLNSNFRTNANILNFVNSVFNTIMTTKTSGIDYKNKSQFEPKAVYEDIENEVCVSLNIINTDKNKMNFEPKNVYDITSLENIGDSKEKNEEQCLLICKKILDLLGTNIYDKELKKFRKLTFKDFTILLSTRGSFLNSLSNMFTEIGIPYIANTTNNLEEVFDNLILYNLLNYSQNKNDDYSLYAILNSNLFNFSDNELAQIKNAFSEDEYFYESFYNYSMLNDKLASKIKYFYETIDKFNFNIKYKGIYFSLNDIILKTNYFLNISEETDFIVRKRYIEQFINSFSNSKYNYNLTEYLNYREISISNKKVEQLHSSIDAVEITTMHSSKGLEYPVVILPNLNDDFSKSPIGNDIKINKEFGLGIKAYNQEERNFTNGIFYETCKIKNKQIEQSEKIRLLYVAMTRAKNQLILIGNNNQKFNKFNDDYEIMSTNNYLSLIVNSLNKSLIEKINNGINFSSTINNNNKLIINVTSIKKEELNYNKEIIPTISYEIEENKILEFLNKDLSIQSNNISLKNSVSQFNKIEINTHKINEENITLINQSNNNEMGTLYHNLLENINFNNVNSISDIELYIKCNYNEDEIKIFNKLKYVNIFNSILTLKKQIQNSAYIFKEQKFVMYIPYNEVEESDISEKILIQGIIDLLIVKENEIILIDYKLSRKNDDTIKNTYTKQLELYEKAISKQFKNKKITKYILNLYTGKLINLD